MHVYYMSSIERHDSSITELPRFASLFVAMPRGGYVDEEDEVGRFFRTGLRWIWNGPANRQRWF